MFDFFNPIESLVILGDGFGHLFGVPVFLIVMLALSNVFMVFAWYAHLRFKYLKLWIVIGLSWMIAFIEYMFHVPANRYGFLHESLPQLKVLQEAMALIAFIIFSRFFLKEKLHAKQAVGFVFIFLAVIAINLENII